MSRPEDSIPDTPENRKAREFLAKAPQKGLWQPLGIEVKVMKCWRCGAYGHRSGDRECPKFIEGNSSLEAHRKIIEDPMAAHIAEQKQELKASTAAAKAKRLAELQAMLKEAEGWAASGKLKVPCGRSSSSSSSSDSSSSGEEEKERKSHRHHHRRHRKHGDDEKSHKHGRSRSKSPEDRRPSKKK